MKMIAGLVCWSLIVGVSGLAPIATIAVLLKPEAFDSQSRISAVMALFAVVFFWAYTLGKVTK